MTMEVKSKRYGTPQYKSTAIGMWKKRGVICDDFDMLYEEYIKATNCQHWDKDFKSTRDRCLDHDHTTGEFRKFVCQKCNAYDSYIKYPDGYNHKKWMKESRTSDIVREAYLKAKSKKKNEENDKDVSGKVQKFEADPVLSDTLQKQ